MAIVPSTHPCGNTIGNTVNAPLLPGAATQLVQLLHLVQEAMWSVDLMPSHLKTQHRHLPVWHTAQRRPHLVNGVLLEDLVVRAAFRQLGL
jgi:hypothetical protein